MKDYQKHHAASDALTIVEKITRYLQVNKINWQRGALVKTEEQKYTLFNEYRQMPY